MFDMFYELSKFIKRISAEVRRIFIKKFINMENTAEVCQYLTNIIPDDNTDLVHTYYLMIHQVEESHYQGD